jgi:hypothetical protein
VTLFAKVSPRWDEIIARAIHPAPDRRYQDAGEFRAHINVAMKQEAGVALPDALEPKPKNMPKKKPALTQRQQLLLTFGFVGAVVAALLMLIFWPVSRGSSQALMSGSSTEATPSEVRQVLQALDTSDPELTRLLDSFAQDWASSGAGKDPDVAEKLRSAQHATLSAKVKSRVEAARRVEILSAELEKLPGVPSLKALQQAVGK